MPSLDDLPQELVRPILEKLASERSVALFQLNLVNRKWNSLAKPLSYRSIVFDEPSSDERERDCDWLGSRRIPLLIESLIAEPSLSRLIQSIDVRDLETTPCSHLGQKTAPEIAEKITGCINSYYPDLSKSEKVTEKWVKSLIEERRREAFLVYGLTLLSNLKAVSLYTGSFGSTSQTKFFELVQMHPDSHGCEHDGLRAVELVRLTDRNSPSKSNGDLIIDVMKLPSLRVLQLCNFAISTSLDDLYTYHTYAEFNIRALEILGQSPIGIMSITTLVSKCTQLQYFCFQSDDLKRFDCGVHEVSRIFNGQSLKALCLIHGQYRKAEGHSCRRKEPGTSSGSWDFPELEILEINFEIIRGALESNPAWLVESLTGNTKRLAIEACSMTIRRFAAVAGAVRSVLEAKESKLHGLEEISLSIAWRTKVYGNKYDDSRELGELAAAARDKGVRLVRMPIYPSEDKQVRQSYHVNHDYSMRPSSDPKTDLTLVSDPLDDLEAISKIIEDEP